MLRIDNIDTRRARRIKQSLQDKSDGKTLLQLYTTLWLGTNGSKKRFLETWRDSYGMDRTVMENLDVKLVTEKTMIAVYKINFSMRHLGVPV